VSGIDGVNVRAELYRAAAPGRPCLALFHQSGSSRGEYRSIAPHLAARGYTALAVDLRWGRRDRFNLVDNETARAAGSAEVLAGNDQDRRRVLEESSRDDMLRALRWLAARPDCSAGVVPWGSSITANHVLALAARGVEPLRGVVAFSPGEYDAARPEAMRTAVRTLSVPAFVAWGRGEAELAEPVFVAIPAGRARRHASRLGFHGSSILLDDPAAWPPLLAFLDDLAL
jgi:dienelactone hydrolase